MKHNRDWFTPGMVAAVALAWLWPAGGMDGGVLRGEWLTKVGVALIFFLYGLTLSFAALRAGALHWRLHLVVQGTTFLVFPLLGLALVTLAPAAVSADLRLGFFFLCALPSTISSSVALTAAAGGNVAAAVFNATLSSLIGVVLTPLWMAFYLSSGGEGGPLLPVIVDLVLWLLLPMAAGQACRPWLGAWAGRQKGRLHVADRLVILLIIYTSFCNSVQSGLWLGRGATLLLVTLGLCALLFMIAMLLTAWVSRLLGFAWPDRITAMFCGSKKTLASGVPMANLIFAGQPVLGIVLLPIMVYHSMQLLASGVLAARWAKTGAPDGLRI
ncbi:MAG: bile acid:sodium symporter [Opitutaceae bacterium]|nr:bile acid:sodium symporter [Opitutaceae bacterium]